MIKFLLLLWVFGAIAINSHPTLAWLGSRAKAQLKT
jgi:hypothetical protein